MILTHREMPHQVEVLTPQDIGAEVPSSASICK
jgi:hypothetical protein